MSQSAWLVVACAAVTGVTLGAPARSSADNCTPASGQPLTPPAQVAVPHCDPDPASYPLPGSAYYLVALHVGDTLHIAPSPGSGAAYGRLWEFPPLGPDLSEVQSLCYWEFDDSGEYVSPAGAPSPNHCQVTRNRSYLMSASQYTTATPPASLAVTVTPFVNQHAAEASCDIAHAPTIGYLKRQITMPAECPSGRSYYRFRVDRAGRRVSFYAAHPEDTNDGQFGAYDARTTEFNIARRRTLCDGYSFAIGNERTCRFARAGRYLLAFTNGPSTFALRKVPLPRRHR